MELNEIIARYAEGLSAIDTDITLERANQRTGEIYLPGLKTMRERDAVSGLDTWWGNTYPSDFVAPDAHAIEVVYPGGGRNACDHVFTTVGNPSDPEWAIELKYLQLVGDNGKRNDYAVAKALSPFLKDRSLYHDILRLRATPIARRLAVVGFSFTYNDETCAKALQLHPDHTDRIDEIIDVCRTNEGSLSPRPLVEFADGIFGIKELVTGNYIKAEFEAWRHPCGGRGVVFGWEVKRHGHQSLEANW